MPDQTARASFEAVNTYPPAAPPNVFRQTAIDVIFGQVWTRPGLSRRQRRWVSLSAVGMAGGLEYGQVWARPQLPRADRRLITITVLAKQGHPAELRAHLAAAADSGDLSVAALREVALHAGLYAGLMTGRAIDQAINESIDQAVSAVSAWPPAG